MSAQIAAQTARTLDHLAVPRTFYDDHAGRDLATPKAVGRCGADRVVIRKDDPANAELLADAEFYAGDSMDECPISIKRSAYRTVRAFENAGLRTALVKAGAL